MAYVRLEDLITWAVYTWCFDFTNIEEDLYDVITLALKEGINQIGLANGKVIYLTEHDINDVVDYLVPYVEAFLEEINEEEITY